MSSGAKAECTADELGPCPGCGVIVAVSLEPMSSGGPGLLHPIPMCDYFERTNIDVIARDMRIAIEQSKRS